MSAISKSTIFCAVLMLAAFGVAALLYDRLPDVMPVHWSISGQVDGFMRKPWSVYFPPIMVAAILLLKLVLPAISPRAFAIEPFAQAFNILMVALMLFVAYVMGLVYLNAFTGHVPVVRAVMGGVGALFMVLGNFLGKTTPNFFVGIRVPWTLADNEVWAKTHRLAGWLFVLAGIVTIAVAVLDKFRGAGIAALAAAIIIPVVYSLIISVRR